MCFCCKYAQMEICEIVAKLTTKIFTQVNEKLISRNKFVKLVRNLKLSHGSPTALGVIKFVENHRCSS